jgi:hypothetical protein
MSKPIVISTSQWHKLEHRLRTDYSPSVTMIRTKMRDVLGFVPREYAEWNTEERGEPWSSDIRLDFYDERKRTMFMLKYSEYLQK